MYSTIIHYMYSTIIRYMYSSYMYTIVCRIMFPKLVTGYVNYNYSDVESISQLV